MSKPLSQIVNQQLEAQRFTAQQASREQAEVDPRSMLLVLQTLIEQGRTDEAKARYAEYKRGN